jgi:hypothetical protein
LEGIFTARAALHKPRFAHGRSASRLRGGGQMRHTGEGFWIGSDRGRRGMTRFKIVVFVPEADGERVRSAMGEAGAGRIGNYSHCSFTTSGVGRFTPLAGAIPAIGAVGRPEAVVEERIETLCAEEVLKPVLAAIRRAHPYEEPAIDIYPLAEID